LAFLACAVTIISTSDTTRGPATRGTATQLNDASGVREEIATLRDHLDILINQIMWNDCLGDCCQHLLQAKLHLLSARDASHRWEGRVHPLQQTVAPLDNNTL
jgi:hypothetical protein